VTRQLRRAIGEAVPNATKQLLDELIDRIEIKPDRHTQPYFWIPDSANAGQRGPGQQLDPVRMRSLVVEVAGIEPASFGGKGGLLRAQPVSCSRPHRAHRHAGDG
jgi:hypothetical protein